jgi:hypothetical protein
MDFTALLLIVLMLLAVQNNAYPIAIGLLALLLVSTKGKYLVAAVAVGALVAFASPYFSSEPLILIGGLFLVLLLIVKGDSGGAGGPQGYYPG